MEHLRQAWRRQAWTDAETIRGYQLPTGGQFSNGQGHLDPDIFDVQERMHPWIRNSVLLLLDAFWRPRYPDWRDWARVYLAGSLASYWWGTSDMDILIGVHADKLFRAHPEILNATANAEEHEVSQMLTQEFYDGLDQWVRGFKFPPALDLQYLCETHGVSTGEAYEKCPPSLTPFAPDDFTFYCNADSYDIRKIQPYAAYDLTRDLWAVHPSHPSSRYGPHSFNWSFWNRMADLADQIRDALETDDPTERREDAQALYDKIHSERNQAFGPGGAGQWDPRGLQWTVMSRWGLLGALERELHPDRPVGHPAPLRA